MKVYGKDAAARDAVMRLFGKPNKKVDQYYILLGQFVNCYAFLERDVQAVLWRLAKLETPISQSVLSGVRTEAAVALIYRIADAERWSKCRKEAYKNILDQIQVLNKLRNDLLHRGSELQQDGTWLITNLPFVHIPERITNISMTVSDLKHAYNDLIIVRLVVSLILDDEVHSEEWWNKSKLLSWSYKPAPQGRKAQTNR
ncbi:hypothetical protein [Bradyrhizobium sp. dw_411]|uniref:hypothetical protein n=1 Tax=Bradyrhizobium sp. dw_411 TaxID=2720082 RepID=UPI001BD1A5AB|nr:hypothetical protein [Bradyrhizobium sp. dw_411]